MMPKKSGTPHPLIPLSAVRWTSAARCWCPSSCTSAMPWNMGCHVSQKQYPFTDHVSMASAWLRIKFLVVQFTMHTHSPLHIGSGHPNPPSQAPQPHPFFHFVEIYSSPGIAGYSAPGEACHQNRWAVGWGKGSPSGSIDAWRRCYVARHGLGYVQRQLCLRAGELRRRRPAWCGGCLSDVLSSKTHDRPRKGEPLKC